ncbi:MAG: response regulator transcription factor [Chloroflexi bacterium]|nr:response regulator transcription factor [Chloroflexota bacterium]
MTDHLLQSGPVPERCNRAPRVIIASGDGLSWDTLARAMAQRRDVEFVGAARDELSVLKLCIDSDADLMLVNADLPEAGGFRTAIEARAVRPGLGILLIGDELDPVLAADLMSGGTSGTGILFQNGLDSFDMLVQAILIVADGGSVIERSLVGHLISPSGTLSDGLTPREWEMLGAIAEGWSNSVIADQLGLAVRTVENRVGCIFTKLKLSGRSDRHSRVSAALHYLNKCKSIRKESRQNVISDDPAATLIEPDTVIQ